MIPGTGSRWIDSRKSPDPAGKHRKSLEHGSSIPTGNCPDFFRWIPVNFLRFPAGTGRKSSEKIRKFSGRNTASTKSPGTGSFRTELFDLGIGIHIDLFNFLSRINETRILYIYYLHYSLNNVAYNSKEKIDRLSEEKIKENS
jgi:hypothetical protein